MHDLASSFVLGFHGCVDDVARKLVLREESFRPSENSYDWLGHGIYFWLEDPRRACAWAQRHVAGTGNGKPAVIGAVINLGRCLDLTTRAGIEAVRSGHEALKAVFESGLTRRNIVVAGLDFLLPYFDDKGGRMPENRPAKPDDGDILIRRLDCAVINMTCNILDEGPHPVDTVKGVFFEGGPAYEGAQIHERTHTQICVRNAACIRGIFYPPQEDLGHDAKGCLKQA